MWIWYTLRKNCGDFMKQLERVIPKYCENIIVAAVYKNHFEWYVTPRELWRLDFIKWHEVWKQYSMKILKKSEEQFENECGTLERMSEFRWGITVLDEKTAGQFFWHIYKCSYSADELRSLRFITPDEDKNSYLPMIYVDFDSREFISYCPEPLNLEDYVPDGWVGKYELFIDRIPADKRFW